MNQLSKNTLAQNKLNQHQSGFSMLEVLITVFILSVGLLGVAGMQAASIKLSHESHLRSQASLLAYDMADRMRANGASATGGDYDRTLTRTQTGLNPDCSTPGTACSPNQIAAVDLANWDFKLNQTFPGVNATIATQTVQGETIGTITLTWIDTDVEAIDDDPEARRFTLRTVI